MSVHLLRHAGHMSSHTGLFLAPFTLETHLSFLLASISLSLILLPFREVYNNFTSGSGEAKQPRWILVIGAFGIVFGLAMYGYRIIAVSGVV